MAGKHAVAAVTMLLMTLSLGGCFLLDPYGAQERQDNLDAAVAEFQAPTLGEVLCEGSGGKPTPNNGFTHFFVIEGDDIVAVVAAQLEATGYFGTHRPDTLTYSRADGVGMEGYLLGYSDYTEELEASLAADECEFPSKGTMYVKFRESPSTELTD